MTSVVKGENTKAAATLQGVLRYYTSCRTRRPPAASAAAAALHCQAVASIYALTTVSPSRSKPHSKLGFLRALPLQQGRHTSRRSEEGAGMLMLAAGNGAAVGGQGSRQHNRPTQHAQWRGWVQGGRQLTRCSCRSWPSPCCKSPRWWSRCREGGGHMSGDSATG